MLFALHTIYRSICVKCGCRNMYISHIQLPEEMPLYAVHQAISYLFRNGDAGRRSDEHTIGLLFAISKQLCVAQSRAFPSFHRSPLLPLRVQEWSGNVQTPVNFRLIANPTKQSNGMRMKLVGAECVRWFERKFETCDVSGLRVTPITAIHESNLRHRQLHLHRVLFEGRITSAAPELLHLLVTGGVGRGKAFGCGLLQLEGIHYG
jgi:CRISPR-associated protein Cas6/Cse3/CasE subtype I-E